MSRLALRLLGPPRVELDGEPVHVGRRKALALLAYLAVTQRAHTRDSLATRLWPDYDRSGGRTALRSTLSTLTRALGSAWLDADRESVRVSPDADLWLDVHEFRRLLQTCERHGHAAGEECTECGQLLEQAAALYEDDFLAGFTLPDSPGFDEWQLFETEGLRDELGSVLERLARLHSAQGAHEEAIAYGRRWVALDPLHEPAQRALMEAYAQAGQRAAAPGRARAPSLGRDDRTVRADILGGARLRADGGRASTP
jgi:DNA-binding SARP family transcriptional activator